MERVKIFSFGRGDRRNAEAEAIRYKRALLVDGIFSIVFKKPGKFLVVPQGAQEAHQTTLFSKED
jgi:hypothetical protein